MANKRTEKSVTPKSSAFRAKEITKKTPTENSAKRSFDYFRISESYTSLILGIVVVVITSILLIAFLRNRTNMNTPQPTKDISTAMKIGPTISPTDAPIDIVSKAISQPITPTVTQGATPTPIITVTNTPVTP
jgi:hypothetical protein